jgi:threonine/homoserine/homoserine lactone efflux protein
MTLSTLLYFLGASFVLIIAPGPDNMFVLSQGIAHGKRTAMVTALGMASGISVHTTATACGISVLLYSSVAAFNLVRYAGAAYLFFLAWQSFREQSKLKTAYIGNGSAFSLFKRGFIMDVLNPKVTMFFLAFLPQFVPPTTGHFALKIWLLGLLFMLQVAIILCLIGYFSGSVGRSTQARPEMTRPLRWLTTGVFASLGARLVLTEK